MLVNMISPSAPGRFAAALWLLIVFHHSAPMNVNAQGMPEEGWEDAARALGLTREEALRLYEQQVKPSTAAADTGVTEEGAPGRTALPDSSIVVILPLERERRELEKNRVADIDSTDMELEKETKLFGREFFRLGPELFSPSSFGPVPDDYLIGLGDEIVVDAWGDVEFRFERMVDRDGTVTLPRAGRVLAAGLTLDAFERRVQERLAQSYSGISLAGSEDGTTQVDVSLGKLRSFRVYVIGEVSHPGGYDLSSAATMFTALYASGGPAVTGSMRDIRLVRGGKVVGNLDIYAFLLGGDRSGDLLLKENDTVFIPPRGRSVDLAGGVRREMRFELRPGETMADLVRFGGGFDPQASREWIHVERIVPPADRRPGHPDRIFVDVALDPVSGEPLDRSSAELLDGDIVSVGVISDRATDWVEISGAVKYPGRYQYAANMDLADLLRRAGDSWPDALEDRAIIDREAPDGTYQLVDVPLRDVLDGNGPFILLQPRDHVSVLSKWDVEARDYVYVSGEVRSPGQFPFRQGMTLRDLVLRAGGFLESADIERVNIERAHTDQLAPGNESQRPQGSTRSGKIELLDVALGEDFLTAKTSIPLEPGDRVAVRQLPWWSSQGTVTILGEVRYPGVYSLSHSRETISDIVGRAQGLKDTAFLPGARIIRSKDGIGNVAIDLECALEKRHSECDLILVKDDDLLIPTAPQTVKVVGAVGYQTSIPYVEGKRIGYYVDRAGGYGETAEKWSTRVVYPNGIARPIKRFWMDPVVMAGSSVVVPTKPPETAGQRWQSVERVAAIMASLATTYLVIKEVE